MEDAGRDPATQPLRDEYAALEPVLSGVEMLSDRVRRGQRAHTLLLIGALTWLEAFQRRHDRKIESVLLPALDARDSAYAGLVDDVRRMHGEARRRLAELRRGMEASTMLNPAICQLAAECVASLRAHVASELEGLLATADRVISADEAASLQEGFRRVDDRETRPGERQALRALARAIDPGREPRTETTAYTAEIVAAHVMRAWPRTVRPADTLARAAELMDQAHVRELPVVADGRLCGIVSRTDLEAHAGHLEWTGVEAAMTPRPVVVTPEQPVAAVSQVLMRGRFNAVPVVGDDAILIGMISRSDMLRAVADHANGHVR
jgi:CBS domain-containing protein